MKVLIALLFILNVWQNVCAYESETQAVQKSVKYGNKHFIADRLMSIFGEDAKLVIEKNIILGHVDLGGPCDLYEQEYKNENDVVDNQTKCLHGKLGATAPLSGKDTVIRTSLIAKTCISLLNDEKIFKTFEKEIETAQDSHEEVYKKFYPLDNAKELKLTEAELNKFDDSQSERLKRMSLYYCVSEAWQRI